MGKHTITRAYRIRVYPTGAQRRTLPRILGAVRWLKGHALDLRSSTYEHYNIRLTGVDLSRMLTGWKKTAGHEWLCEVPATCLTQALLNLDKAFTNFFEGRAKYPKRPRKTHRQSARFQDVSEVQWAKGVLSLPKIGVLRTAEPLPKVIRTLKSKTKLPEGTAPKTAVGPAMVTLTREPSGEYYVSFSAEAEVERLPSTGKAVGVDLGVSTLATLSTGEKKHYLSKLRAKQRYLKRCQRALTRTQKGSNRRQRARVRLAKAHAKVADYRRNCIHEITTELVRNNDIICIEDLNVKGLARGFLAGSIQDAAFSEFRRQLTYKCQGYGRELVVIDRYFASSKTCSCCGTKNIELKLSDRKWRCTSCGALHDRDANAARCIVADGLRILSSHRETATDKLQSQPRSGCEGPRNGRQDTRGYNRSVSAPVVLVHEASTVQ